MSIPQSGGGPIEHHDQLAEYLASGCKPKADWRIGTEHEKFGYCKDTLLPIPYEGERSVLAVLEGLRDGHGWAPVEEAGKPVNMLACAGNVQMPGERACSNTTELSDNSSRNGVVGRSYQ